MERISNDMQRMQVHRRNPFPPPVHARYAKFLPATQNFCPFFRFLVQSHFFTADLRAFCAKSAAGPLQWAFPAATTAVPVTNQSPLGGLGGRVALPTVSSFPLLSHTGKSVGALSRADRLN